MARPLAAGATAAMSFPVFKSREDAERHLVALNYTPREDGTFSHMMLVLTVEETPDGFTIHANHPALQEMHERSQTSLEESLHLHRRTLFGRGS